MVLSENDPDVCLSMHSDSSSNTRFPSHRSRPAEMAQLTADGHESQVSLVPIAPTDNRFAHDVDLDAREIDKCTSQLFSGDHDAASPSHSAGESKNASGITTRPILTEHSRVSYEKQPSNLYSLEKARWVGDIFYLYFSIPNLVPSSKLTIRQMS